MTTSQVQNMRLIEAGHIVGNAKEGGRFQICAIKAGVSLNGNYYSDEVLREALPLFNSARVLVKSDREHTSTTGDGVDVRNVIGKLEKVSFIEGAAPDTGAVHAELVLISPGDAISRKLKDACDRGLNDTFGFSIIACGQVQPKVVEGRNVMSMERIITIESVDLIVHPAAGGELIKMVEAQKQNTTAQQKEINMSDNTQSKDEAVQAADTAATEPKKKDEAVKEDNKKKKDSPTEQPSEQKAEQVVATESVRRMVETITYSVTAVAESGLPEIAQQKLRKAFETGTWTREGIDARIAEERDYLAKFTESGKPSGLGGARASVLEDQTEKHSDMWGHVFDDETEEHVSLKEAYIAVTGDQKVTGRLSESITTTTTGIVDLIGAALGKRLLKEYKIPDQYSVWRSVADVVPVNDFRERHVITVGGYSDTPVVNEGAKYQSLTDPSTEKSKYQVEKHGGLADITFEAIKNDDVGLVRRIPRKLAQAAKRTLAKNVLSVFSDNPDITIDGKKLFHTDHSNTGTATLTAASLSAARLKMLGQQEPGEKDTLGVPPKFLLVPFALQEKAYNLFKRTTNQDKTFVQDWAPTILPIWFWDDADAWFLVASPKEIPCLEVGFLDGKQEPEILVQNDPRSGSLFTNDKITYKLRHIYGVGLVDYRGLYGSIPA
ncbi:MAG: phage major capsid protein [Pseudomonadota bacterium]